MIGNNLVNEKSPYLQQHAYNPVNWSTWTTERLEQAITENKLIFLSIGYSTCHWCHVMEKESFEDLDVAEILNKNFIPIKVDKEERPDLDSIYMKACQRLTGSGGWPLNLILTPTKLPLYAFTYLPKESKNNMFGLMDVLDKINELWNEDKEGVIEKANDFANLLSRRIKKNTVKIDLDTTDKALESFRKLYDPSYGGFGAFPKFPSPHNLTFLLRKYKTSSETELLRMVEHTLKSMYSGGIYDHVGLGFSRYSVDNKWLIPHFEKMLYDNALLADAYLEAYQVTKNPIYKKINESIFVFIDNEMTSKQGAFYSALDADSEGEEGKFYSFSRDEVYKVLQEEAPRICANYNVTESGNFEGSNILNLINTDLNNYLVDTERLKLYNYREKRIRPHRDEKILTSWNAMMISALSNSGRVFNKEIYIKIAEKAADFIMKQLIDKNRLLARYIDGESLHSGYLNDYAYLIEAFINLYEATFKVEHLRTAIKLNKESIDLFYDFESGGFYLTGRDSEKLIYRPKESFDGAIPSGNSITIKNMIRLSRITRDEELLGYVKSSIDYFSDDINEFPTGHSAMLSAILMMLNPSEEIIIVGEKNNKELNKALVYLNDKYAPFTTIIYKDETSEKLLPYLSKYEHVGKDFTIYICKDYACYKPVTNFEDLESFYDKELDD